MQTARAGLLSRVTDVREAAKTWRRARGEFFRSYYLLVLSADQNVIDESQCNR